MLLPDLATFFPGKPKYHTAIPILYKRPVDENLITKINTEFRSFLDSVEPIGIQQIIIGLSGGIDSAIACALLQCSGINSSAVIIELDNILQLSKETQFAVSIANKIGMDYKIINASRLYTEHLRLLERNSSLTRIHMRSRLITNIIFQFADHHSGAVVDTTDKSEDILKIYEESFRGHLAPLIGLYKSELYDLADYFGLPELKEKKSGCQELIDIDAFGVPWQNLDPILHLLIVKKMSRKDISRLYGIDDSWLEKIEKRIMTQPLRTTVKKFSLTGL